MLRKLSVGSVALLALGLGLSSAAMAAPPTPTTPVCTQASVPSLGGFNQAAICPTGHYATGGGYELVTTDFSQLLGASVNESMPQFGGSGGVQPIGWEVVGSNLTTIPGTIRVCVICN